MEVWKDIEGYEGYYQVSNKGNVKSLSRKMWNGKSYWYSKEKLLKRRIDKNKKHYATVCLRKDGVSKTKLIHRLVALSFLNKIDGKNYVNHIDLDKLNNKLDNLEWVSASENLNYSDNQIKKGDNRSTKVKGTHIETGEIIFFNTKREAMNKGFNKSTISKVVNNPKRTYKNYRWINIAK